VRGLIYRASAPMKRKLFRLDAFDETAPGLPVATGSLIALAVSTEIEVVDSTIGFGDLIAHGIPRVVPNDPFRVVVHGIVLIVHRAVVVVHRRVIEVHLAVFIIHGIVIPVGHVGETTLGKNDH